MILFSKYNGTLRPVEGVPGDKSEADKRHYKADCHP